MSTILSDFLPLFGSIGLLTGFEDLDRLLGGIPRGSLVTLAAHTSMGKTGFALSITESIILEQGAKVLYFSPEMPKEQVLQRLTSLKAFANFLNLSGDISEFEEIGIFVDESHRLEVSYIIDRSQYMHKLYGLRLIVIDGLRHVYEDGGSLEEKPYITSKLKNLARILDIPILVTSRLLPNISGRLNKRPYISDLNQIGDIVQDSDIVMFVYRDEVYNKNTERPNIAEIIVAKHRHGLTGTAELHFTHENAKFTSLKTYFGPPAAPMDVGLDDIVF